MEELYSVQHVYSALPKRLGLTERSGADYEDADCLLCISEKICADTAVLQLMTILPRKSDIESAGPRE
jgi:hypothetical protein